MNEILTRFKYGQTLNNITDIRDTAPLWGKYCEIRSHDNQTMASGLLKGYRWVFPTTEEAKSRLQWQWGSQFPHEAPFLVFDGFEVLFNVNYQYGWSLIELVEIAPESDGNA